MHLNPFLSSLAAPVAGKTLQAVTQVAHEAGQSFLKVFSSLREPEAMAATEAESLTGQLQQLAANFRDWLGQQGIRTPFEMQFSLSKQGEPIANVVGQDSAKIVDLLYSHEGWLERLSSTVSNLQQHSETTPHSLPMDFGQGSVKLAISSHDSYVLREPTNAPRKNG